MSNDKKFKCIPQNLSMSESSPVCQPWSYASGHPMKAMLDSSYFLSAYDRLRPGDTIRIVQMKSQNIHARDNEVLSFADALVLKTGKVSVDMHIEKRISFDKTTGGAPEENIGKPGNSDGLTLGYLQRSLESVAKRVEEFEGSVKTSFSVFDEKMGAVIDSVTGTRHAGDELNDQLEGIRDSIGEISVVVNALKEFVEAAEETPVIRWNPGQREHEAVTGEGGDLKVLFSDKDKKKVEAWLANKE